MLLGLLLIFLAISILIIQLIWDPTPQKRRNRARRTSNFSVQHHGQVGTDSQSGSSYSQSDSSHSYVQDPLNSYNDRCDYGSSYDSGSSSSYDSSSCYDSGSSSYDSGSSSSYDSGSSSSSSDSGW